MGVSKNRGGFPPKMDGENNGKPYEQMDELVGFPIFLGWHPYTKVVDFIQACLLFKHLPRPRRISSMRYQRIVSTAGSEKCIEKKPPETQKIDS